MKPGNNYIEIVGGKVVNQKFDRDVPDLLGLDLDDALKLLEDNWWEKDDEMIYDVTKTGWVSFVKITRGIFPFMFPT